MENKIDLTYAVWVDAAAQNIETVLSQMAGDFTPDILELALERCLSEVRASKCELYATALVNAQQKQNPEGQGPNDGRVTKSGTVDEMIDDLKAHGVDVNDERK